MPHRRPGFTILELLVVIALIASLAAMLFPVFAEARRAALKNADIGNVSQIGRAIDLYRHDADDAFPNGVDAETKHGTCDGIGATRPEGVLLSAQLNPYAKSDRIWRCPLDDGIPDRGGDFNEASDCSLPGTLPSVFEKYGSSYRYRTELSEPPESTARRAGSAGVAVLWNMHGDWLGGPAVPDKRYTTLFADGHVKVLAPLGLAPHRSVFPDP